METWLSITMRRLARRYLGDEAQIEAILIPLALFVALFLLAGRRIVVQQAGMSGAHRTGSHIPPGTRAGTLGARVQTRA